MWEPSFDTARTQIRGRELLDAAAVSQIDPATPEMNVDVHVEVLPDYLKITAVGQYTFELLFDFIARVKAEADKSGKTRVLIDCARVTGGMAEFERFHGGKRIAEVFGGTLKAALVMPSQNVTKLGELAAVNRGARFFVTDSAEDAVRWLTDGP